MHFKIDWESFHHRMIIRETSSMDVPSWLEGRQHLLVWFGLFILTILHQVYTYHTVQVKKAQSAAAAKAIQNDERIRLAREKQQQLLVDEMKGMTREDPNEAVKEAQREYKRLDAKQKRINRDPDRPQIKRYGGGDGGSKVVSSITERYKGRGCGPKGG
jgi:hypothetical protein